MQHYVCCISVFMQVMFEVAARRVLPSKTSQGHRGVDSVVCNDCFHCQCTFTYDLVEAHCYGIGRTGQIFEQSRSSVAVQKFAQSIYICFEVPRNREV